MQCKCRPLSHTKPQKRFLRLCMGQREILTVHAFSVLSCYYAFMSCRLVNSLVYYFPSDLLLSFIHIKQHSNVFDNLHLHLKLHSFVIFNKIVSRPSQCLGWIFFQYSAIFFTLIVSFSTVTTSKGDTSICILSLT